MPYPSAKNKALKQEKNSVILTEKTLFFSGDIFIEDILADTILSTQIHKKMILTAIMPIGNLPVEIPAFYQMPSPSSNNLKPIKINASPPRVSITLPNLHPKNAPK